jgi:PAS domain S-box-containing protein
MRIIGALTDISERKRAQEALEQAANRFELVTLATQDALYDWDLVSREIWRNENYQRLFGAPGRNSDSDNWWLDRLHPGDRERVVTAQVAALGSEDKAFSAEYRLRRPDGSYADIVQRSLIVRDAEGQAVRMIGALTDVSEDKRAHEALRKSEEDLRSFIENVPLGVYRTTPDGRVLMANSALLRMLGYNSWQELASRNLEREGYEAGYPRSAFREQIERQGEVRDLEAPWKRRDGSVVFVREFARTIRADDGRVLYYDGTIEDITDRRRAQEALTASEQRYRELFENAMDIVFTYDLRGNFTSVNKVGEQSSGYTRVELARMNVLQILAPEYAEEGRRVLEGLAAGREPGIGEWEIVTKDGRRIWLEVALRLVRRNGELAEVQGIARDITARKRAEEQLRDYLAQLHALAARLHSAREEERARVAREIHDELGQNLTAIKIDLTSIFRKLGENAKPLSGATEAILKLVEQTIRTVRRMATELRPAILDDLGLTAAIEWATEEFQARTGIKCHLELREEHIVLDRQRTTAIFRIFQETLTNVARHSGATELHIRLFRQNANTTLEVRDNGVGIQPQHLTSPASLGILGMRERALVLDGQFEIAGRPGEGTKVTVRIPDVSFAVEA